MGSDQEYLLKYNLLYSCTYKIIRKLKVCVSHTQNIISKSISLIVKSSDQSTAKNLHTTYIHKYLYTNYLVLHDFAMKFFKRAWKKTLLTLKISKRHRSHGREERRRLLQRRRYKVTGRRRKTRETSVVNTAKYSECDNFHEIFFKSSVSFQVKMLPVAWKTRWKISPN